MDEISLYQHILGVNAPWFVELVQLDKTKDEVRVFVEIEDDAVLLCPECQQPSPRYDKRRRQWRHLDTCQLLTFVEADVPRVQCSDHGCRTIQVPWADGSARYTVLFEATVLTHLRTTSINAVREHFRLSWNAVDGIMQRAINRGLARRDPQAGTDRLYVDETQYLKQREYVTVISNALGHVVHVGDGARKTALKSYYHRLTWWQRYCIKSIAMDMSPAYIHATIECIPNAKTKIVFDKFHIARAMNKAVDATRKHEQNRRRNRKLSRGRYLWLKNANRLTTEEERRLRTLRGISQIIARAWRLKEFAKGLWQFNTREAATAVWESWCDDAERSGIMPMKTLAGTIRDKLWGIANAVYHQTSNAQAESINSRIKLVKTRARGFRNRDRYKRAIYFYCGGLDLMPETSTH